MEMKEITITVCGTDGAPHGHGSWERDSEVWEVSEKQYSQIAQYVEEGENDLLHMAVYGLKGKCKEVVKDVLYWARERGEDTSEYRIYIYVDLMEEDEDRPLTPEEEEENRRREAEYQEREKERQKRIEEYRIAAEKERQAHQERVRYELNRIRNMSEEEKQKWFSSFPSFDDIDLIVKKSANEQNEYYLKYKECFDFIWGEYAALCYLINDSRDIGKTPCHASFVSHEIERIIHLFSHYYRYIETENFPYTELLLDLIPNENSFIFLHDNAEVSDVGFEYQKLLILDAWKKKMGVDTISEMEIKELIHKQIEVVSPIIYQLFVPNILMRHINIEKGKPSNK